MRVWFAVLFCVAAVATAGAETTARQVLDQAHQLSRTTRKWSDREQRLKLRIVDRRGGARTRELAIFTKKYPEDRNRTILFFAAPPEVKGVGLLQWADPHAKDEQWLYLPELKRVRQISPGSKHESFVGTDFSYDDFAIMSEISDWTEADANTRLLRQETVEGRVCHVIEYTPTGKDLTYGKILDWITADDLVTLKLEMYDRSARLDKVLSLSDIRTIGEIPTAYHMEMRSLRGGSHTVVDFSEVKYDTHQSDDRFTQRALERGL